MNRFRILTLTCIAIATLASCSSEPEETDEYRGTSRNYKVFYSYFSDDWDFADALTNCPHMSYTEKKENLTNVLVSGWYDFDAKYTVKGSKGDFEAYVKKEETYNDIERHIRLYTFEEGDYGWFNVTSNGIYKFDQLICPLTDFERQDTLSYSLSEKRQTGIERITGSTKKANNETVTITAGSWKFDLVREGIDIITVYDSSDPSTSLITLSRQ